MTTKLKVREEEKGSRQIGTDASKKQEREGKEEREKGIMKTKNSLSVHESKG